MSTPGPGATDQLAQLALVTQQLQQAQDQPQPLTLGPITPDPVVRTLDRAPGSSANSTPMPTFRTLGQTQYNNEGTPILPAGAGSQVAEGGEAPVNNANPRTPSFF